MVGAWGTFIGAGGAEGVGVLMLFPIWLKSCASCAAPIPLDVGVAAAGTPTGARALANAFASLFCNASWICCCCCASWRESVGGGGGARYALVRSCDVDGEEAAPFMVSPQNRIGILPPRRLWRVGLYPVVGDPVVGDLVIGLKLPVGAALTGVLG